MASACIASSALASASLSSSFKSALPSAQVQSSFLGHAISAKPAHKVSYRRGAVISAALKKAVAVLKGESKVTGTITLEQEDDGEESRLVLLVMMCDVGTMWRLRVTSRPACIHTTLVLLHSRQLCFMVNYVVSRAMLSERSL